MNNNLKNTLINNIVPILILIIIAFCFPLSGLVLHTQFRK